MREVSAAFLNVIMLCRLLLGEVIFCVLGGSSNRPSGSHLAPFWHLSGLFAIFAIIANVSAVQDEKST